MKLNNRLNNISNNVLNKICNTLTRALLCGVSLLFCSGSLYAHKHDKWSPARPDGHAPITIMGDHMHKKNEFMVSYRFMPMVMQRNIQGTKQISSEEILKDYQMAPTRMDMLMHMFGIMYAPTDHVTLMVMAHYMDNSMELLHKGEHGGHEQHKDHNHGLAKVAENEITPRTTHLMKHQVSGLGDLSIGGLVKILNLPGNSLHANLSLSIPTGDVTVTQNGHRLAYPMQLGSGTFDPTVGLTYLGQTAAFSWGVQSLYKHRLGENSEGYTLGKVLDAAAWGAWKIVDVFSFSSSLKFKNQGKISGVDSQMEKLRIPTSMPCSSGGNFLDVGLGGNFYVPSGAFKNLRLAVEFTLPIYNNANGTQMLRNNFLSVGLQYSL